MSEYVTDDAEALADWLGGQVESHNVTDPSDEQETWIEAHVGDLARRILASDWMQQHDDAVRAVALEQAAEAWATGDWSDAFSADDVDDDESAVRSMSKWLDDRAARLRAGGGV